MKSQRAGHGMISVVDIATAAILMAIGALGFPVAMPVMWLSELLDLDPTSDVWIIVFTLSSVAGMWVNWILCGKIRKWWSKPKKGKQ